MCAVNKLDQISILVVEDEPIVRMTMNAILRRVGCKIEFAENGSQALKKFRTNIYDLVLMDIGLPDMRGTTVTAEIRKNEINNRTPIIAVTGYPKSEVQDECNASGIDAIYNKPLIGNALQSILIDHANEPGAR